MGYRELHSDSNGCLPGIVLGLYALLCVFMLFGLAFGGHNADATGKLAARVAFWTFLAAGPLGLAVIAIGFRKGQVAGFVGFGIAIALLYSLPLASSEMTLAIVGAR